MCIIESIVPVKKPGKTITVYTQIMKQNHRKKHRRKLLPVKIIILI